MGWGEIVFCLFIYLLFLFLFFWILQVGLKFKSSLDRRLIKLAH